MTRRVHPAGAWVADPVWVQVVTSAGGRCECATSRCHGPAGRCERSSSGSGLVAAPRDAAVPLHRACRLPVAELAAWCPGCLEGAQRRALRVEVEPVGVQLDLLELVSPGGPAAVPVARPTSGKRSGKASGKTAPVWDSVHADQRDSDVAVDRAWACSCPGAAPGLRVCVDGSHPAWMSPSCKASADRHGRCSHTFRPVCGARSWRPDPGLTSEPGRLAICSCGCHYPDGIGDGELEPAPSRNLSENRASGPSVGAASSDLGSELGCRTSVSNGTITQTPGRS